MLDKGDKDIIEDNDDKENLEASKDRIDQSDDINKEEKNKEDEIIEEVDEHDEVDGLLNPCKRTVGGGQLQRNLMLKAGYVITGDFTRVHCQDDTDHFFENGYYETVATIDETEYVVHVLLPGQGLQPHTHDDIEDITVGYGELAYLTWLEGPGVPSNRTVTAGEPVGVEGGVTHAIFAGPQGAVYHEAVQKTIDRQTWFAPT